MFGIIFAFEDESFPNPPYVRIGKASLGRYSTSKQIMFQNGHSCEWSKPLILKTSRKK